MNFNDMISALKADNTLFAFRRDYADGYGDTPMISFYNRKLVANRIEMFYHQLTISHKDDYPFHDYEYEKNNWELWREEDILAHIKTTKSTNKGKYIIP